MGEATGVRLVQPGELPVADACVERFGRTVARLGGLIDTAPLPRLVAERDGEVAGVLAFDAGDDGLEVVVLNALREGEGVGSELMHAALEEAVRRGCGRVWLITTNDNTRAIRFYQRLGMELVDARIGAVDDARRTLKPTIPLTGNDGIPIRHELVFELRSGGVGGVVGWFT
jgi:ribosomal protein S18 acetylase RimI-like enzyme